MYNLSLSVVYLHRMGCVRHSLAPIRVTAGRNASAMWRTSVCISLVQHVATLFGLLFLYIVCQAVANSSFHQLVNRMVMRLEYCCCTGRPNMGLPPVVVVSGYQVGQCHMPGGHLVVIFCSLISICLNSHMSGLKGIENMI